MSGLVHSSKARPIIFPINGEVLSGQLDRVQNITEDVTANRTRRKEVGTLGTVDYKKSSPEFRYSLDQFEYGKLDTFRLLANKPVGTTEVTLDDYKGAISDVCSFLSDEDDVFIGTVVMPKLRLASLGLSIGDPEADVERSFELVGEDYKIYQGDNKYYRRGRATVLSGEATKVITITSPYPVLFPDTTKYISRVTRYNGTTTVELPESAYSYDNVSKELTVTGNAVGDVITYYYSSSTYVGDIWTPNTTDVGAYPAHFWSLYLGTGSYLYNVQSASIEASLDRFDQGEIGSKEKTKFGARENNVSINLGRILSSFTIEEILQGESAGYGVLDVREFVDDVIFIARLYSDEAKTNHLLTFKSINCVMETRNSNRPVDEYNEAEVTISSDNLTISEAAI